MNKIKENNNDLNQKHCANLCQSYQTASPSITSARSGVGGGTLITDMLKAI